MEGKRGRSLLDRVLPSRWMRRDWDRRARENAQHFIACGHSATDSAFWESGRKDLDEAVLRDVELSTEASALEIGCGVGRLLRPLSERIARVYGVDISVEMVERARRALADRPNIEIFPTLGRLEHVADASLDFVYSFIVFQHIPTKKAVSTYMREAGRVLSGEGVFRLQVDGRPREESAAADTWLGVWYEPAELTEALEQARFETVGMWGQGTHYLWATARRGSRSGRPPTRTVRIRRRAWKREALEALLTRMGVDGSGASESVLSGTRCLRELAQRFLQKHSAAPPELFVRHAYEVFLGREADPGGLEFYAREIAAGITPSNTVDCLIASSELEDQLRPEVAAAT